MMTQEIAVKPKTFIPYYGGKSGYQSERIASKLPPHKIYVEPFGGAAGVLLAKEPVALEVYNDMHAGLVNLFKVVRNQNDCEKLLTLLEMTPYARDEWRDCYSGWRNQTDPIEKARMFYVAMAQSFTGVTKGGAWSCGSPIGDKNYSQVFFNKQENIKAVMGRIRNVMIENKPALDLLKKWDNQEVLMYLDPPYVIQTRTGGGNCYEYEMTDAQHIELLEWCLTSKSMILVSGYPSKLYEKYLEQNGWLREDTEAWASSALQSANNGLKGASREKFKRTECLWFNPACIAAIEAQNKPKAKQATLFELEETA